MSETGELSESDLRRLLFEAASNFRTGRDLEAFLNYACRDDQAMLERLRSLLSVRSDADDFFEFEPQVAKDDVAETEGAGEDGLGVSIGRYRLIERIGAGGFGVVYLAEQLEPVRRKVALKIMRLGLENPESVSRFESERQALASMNHPNIARVLDAGTTANGRPFFVMELVDGEPVTDYCDSGKLGIEERLRIFVKVCRAVQHAHQRGVVHRDIKPSNILVETHESVGVPKVIDFGIATDRGAKGESYVMGTPAYMSPEQISNQDPVDTRSDVYSLGILLCELLSGPPSHVPEGVLESGSDRARELLADVSPLLPSEALRSLSQEERAVVLEKRGAVGRRLSELCEKELDWLVRKAIERDPSDRYETVNGLVMDVVRWLDGDPVTARPQTRRYRLGKLVRRNRAVFVAGGIALSGLVLGLGLSTWLYFREKDAKDEQERLRQVAEIARAEEARLREIAGYRVMVTEAAVRIRYGEIEEADRILSAIPVEHTPSSLETFDVFRRVADWHLDQGNRDKLGSRLLAMAYAIASVDRSDTDSISSLLLPAGTALCMTDETERYDWFRNMALARFSETGNPIVAEQVIKVCLLRPADDALLERLKGLSEIVEEDLMSEDGITSKDGNLAPWSAFALAMMAFRSGELDDARKWGNLCLSMDRVNPTCPISAYILMGLVELKAGRNRIAEDFFAIAEREAGGMLGEPLSRGSTQAGFWFDWVNVRLFLEEAGRKVGGGG